MSKQGSAIFYVTIVAMVCLLAGALDLSTSAQAAALLQDQLQPSTTPDNHPTGTPGHPPTVTPTGQPTPGPVVLERLEPNQGLVSVPNQVRIFGANLRQGLRLTIAGVELRNIAEGCTDGTELSAVIPAGIPPGLYDVVASMSSQQVYTLTAGYTAIGADGLDLAVNDYDLWFFPQGVRVERETQVGVNVHRSGGSEVVTPTVQFYLNDPVTGTLLGETTTPPLEPGTNVVGKAVITWTPPITGTFVVYAVVDPMNALDEASETNNVASASVDVRLPKHQFGDVTEPFLHRFAVQHQHQVTTMPTVTLALTATDNEGGSGLASMFMMEHMYNNATRQWEMRQQTGWIPYTNTHAFALSPENGAHYLQAWVGDAAGNVTRTASRAMINFTQAAANMLQGQVHLYRYELQANQSFQARLTIGAGDADLFIWDRQGNRVAYSNNADSAPEMAQVSSQNGGTYQIEVHAYNDCAYSLELCPATAVAVLSEQTSADKELPAAPVVAVTNGPLDQLAVPAAPSADAESLFLPLTVR